MWAYVNVYGVRACLYGVLLLVAADAVYADVLLHHSRILFDFAYTNQGSFNISEPFYK